jgi:hypothetical protein
MAVRDGTAGARGGRLMASVKADLVRILEPYGLKHRDLIKLSKALATYFVGLIDEAVDEGARHARRTLMADLTDSRVLSSLESLDDAYERKAREDSSDKP